MSTMPNPEEATLIGSSIKGREILRTLKDLGEPVTVSDIVSYISTKYLQPGEQMKPLVEAALEAGVRFGYIQKDDNYYFEVTDALEALMEDELDISDDADDADEVDSETSLEYPVKIEQADSISILTPSMMSNASPSLLSEEENNERLALSVERLANASSVAELSDTMKYMRKKVTGSEHDCAACKRHAAQMRRANKRRSGRSSRSRSRSRRRRR